MRNAVATIASRVDRWARLSARVLEDQYGLLESWILPVLATAQHHLLCRVLGSPGGVGLLNHDHQFPPDTPTSVRRTVVLATISIGTLRLYRAAIRRREAAADVTRAIIAATVPTARVASPDSPRAAPVRLYGPVPRGARKRHLLHPPSR